MKGKIITKSNFMTSICLLSSQEHNTHVIIKREVYSLINAGFFIYAFDKGKNLIPNLSNNVYYRGTIHPFTFDFIIKISWAIIKRLHINKLSVWFWTFASLLQGLFVSLSLIRIAYYYKVDLFYACDLWALLASVFLGKLKNKPIVYDAREIESELDDPSSLLSSILWKIQGFLIPKTSKFIVPNQVRAELYSVWYGLNKKPRVILNCPPLMEIVPTNNLRRMLNIKPEEFVVVYAGSLRFDRNLDRVLKSVFLWNKNIKLVMIGSQDAYYKQVLLPLTESLKLQDRIFFLPFVPYEEMLQLIASADIGITIYDQSNLNNFLCASSKMYEYIMVKLPFVGPNFPDIKAVLEEFPVGFTFNPNSEDSIACAIHNALNLRKKQELNVFWEHARMKFNWECEEKKLVEIIQELKDLSLNNQWC